MKKIIIITVFFLSSALYGMSQEEYQSERQRINERIAKVQQELAPKQKELSVLQGEANGIESGIRELEAYLDREQTEYNGQCRKLHEDIAYYDPTTVSARLAERIVNRNLADNEVIKCAQQAHQKKKTFFDSVMQKRALQKDAEREAMVPLQNVLNKQSKSLIRLEACLALFRQDTLVEGVPLPPVYCELPSFVTERVASRTNTGASTCHRAMTCSLSEPPSYDDVVQEEGKLQEN